jgi:hypothetical protein
MLLKLVLKWLSGWEFSGSDPSDRHESVPVEISATTSLRTDERVRLYWSILVEEYKVVRDESKQAELNTFTALQWGAALLGVLAAAGFYHWKNSGFIVASVFLGFVPLLAIASLYIWIGEMVRMKRAGDYLCLLERKAALLIGDRDLEPNLALWPDDKHKVEDWLRLRNSDRTLADPLNWEQWLRETRAPFSWWVFFRPRVRRESLSSSGHQVITSVAKLAFFPAVATLSLGIGTYYCWYALPKLLTVPPSTSVRVVVVALPCTMVAWLLWVAFDIVMIQLFKPPDESIQR